MATKADFTPQEWGMIFGAMPMTGLAIASASPNGPFGMMKEMMSVGMAMAEMLRTGSQNPLINAIIEDVKVRGTKPEAPAGIRTPEDATSAALNHLKEVGAIVDKKCSAEDATAFKSWLVTIAKRVAEASSEGGFFGFGGVKVSEAEKDAIQKVAAALGTKVTV